MFRYCMPTKLAAGEPCGWTAASVSARTLFPLHHNIILFLQNYAGMCDRTVDPKLECIDGKCAAPAAPGPSPPAPSPPTACSNQGVKCYDGDLAEAVSGITCCNNVFTKYYDPMIFREVIDLKCCISYSGCLPHND